MSIEEQRRAAFEAFAIEAFGPGSLELDAAGDYFWQSTRNAFDVWRAALDSVVIELPDREAYSNPDSAGAAIFDCASRVKDAGLKVKP